LMLLTNKIGRINGVSAFQKTSMRQIFAALLTCLFSIKLSPPTAPTILAAPITT
jgi:hypothetical protein